MRAATLRILLLPVLAAFLPPALPAQTAAPASPAAAQNAAPFLPLEIVHPQFRAERVGLIEPECTRLATQLVWFAVQKYNSAVTAGDPAAVATARQWLTTAAHIHPANPSLRHVVDRWRDGKSPAKLEPDEPQPLFVEFLLRCTLRLRANAAADPANPAPAALAACLTDIAAALDPANEDAIYAAEIQLRDGPPPPWARLLRDEPLTP